MDEGGPRAAASDQRPCVMRGEELSGERDVGDVPPIGVNALVKLDGRAAEAETLSRAGG